MRSSKNKRDIYYKALVERNPKYKRNFYARVKSTLVFCISTCTVKKPEKKNVLFYETISEALKAGFRPCKKCNPLENSKRMPEEVEKIIQSVHENPKTKLSSFFIQQRGVNPKMLRNWFLENHNLTFVTYSRMYRINNAYKELKNASQKKDKLKNEKEIDGFSYTLKTLRKKVFPKGLYISRTTSPLGDLFLCATEAGLCLVEFTDRKMLETEFGELQKKLKLSMTAKENHHIKKAKSELKEYFNKKRKIFTVQLDTPGTDFQKKVWNALQLIPFGKTSSYEEQADRIKSSGIKAVARANGYNRLSIIVPCHRVLGNNGELMGYGGGLQRKRWLLDFEKRS